MPIFSYLIQISFNQTDPIQVGNLFSKWDPTKAAALHNTIQHYE